MFELKKEWQQSAFALIEGEHNLVANLANLSSLFFHSIPGLNWAGFYLWNESEGELVLGPFQGKPACLRISPERGVCGQAYSTRQVQRVDDVHTFPDHIACDTDTRSELVVPLLFGGYCVGVLDLDSPTQGHFTETLAQELDELMKNLVPYLWSAEDVQ